MLQEKNAYTGLVVKIKYNHKAFPHGRADHKVKYFHLLESSVDGEKTALLVSSNYIDNAFCKEGEEINFLVENYHEKNKNYFVRLLPPSLSVDNINEIPTIDGRINIIGSMAERALTHSVAYLQYQTDPTPEELFSIADMMFAYLASRLKKE